MEAVAHPYKQDHGASRDDAAFGGAAFGGAAFDGAAFDRAAASDAGWDDAALEDAAFDEAVFGAADPLALTFNLSFDEWVAAGFENGPLPDDAFPFPATYAGRLDRFLDDVTEHEASLARHAARRARSLDRARLWAIGSDEFVLPDARISHADREMWVMRVFISEVATRLRVPEPTASRLLDVSRALVHELPATLEALSAAAISYRHALVIVEQASTLPEQVRAEFERSVLGDAVRLPVTQFQRRAVRARERMHPESIASRTKAAAAERRFAFEADVDGMAWLYHHLPVAQAQAAFNRVTDIAASLQGPGETRTLAQLRSDVAAGLLLDGESGDRTGEAARGIRPTVVVTVPVLTLLGASEEPGQLDGYGPIDPDTARRLAGKATSFMRLLTHPETGAVLSLGRERYKVPKDLRTWVELRDETCRFPGCGRAATRADIDHTLDWAKNGASDAGNLACLCGPHHRLKHKTKWLLRQRGKGVLEWKSPTGRVHTTTPALTLPGMTPPVARTEGTIAGTERPTAGTERRPASSETPPPF